MPGWLNEKIRIPHSNWSPYCEYQMETFRNLPGFHRISPPLFRKRKYPFIPLSLPVFSLLLILFSRLLFKLYMVDTMVGKIKEKNIKHADGKGKDTNVIWADRRDFCFCCYFPPKHLWQCKTVLSGEKALWLRVHTNTLCEKGKRRLR